MDKLRENSRLQRDKKRKNSRVQMDKLRENSRVQMEYILCEFIILSHIHHIHTVDSYILYRTYSTV